MAGRALRVVTAGGHHAAPSAMIVSAAERYVADHHRTSCSTARAKAPRWCPTRDRRVTDRRPRLRERLVPSPPSPMTA